MEPLPLPLQNSSLVAEHQEASPYLYKEPRRRKWARKSRWLKGPGGYLEWGPYYGLWTEEDGLKLKHCQVSWGIYKKGDAKQLRGYGCGNRSYCPGCCVYHRDIMAMEGAEDMLMALEGLEITHDIRPKHYGLKVICTIPKETSAWIDCSDERIGKLNGLFHAQQEFLRKQFGKGVGGVGGLDFAGETDPTEPHYHPGAYVFPARRDGNSWVKLPSWFDLKGQEGKDMRRLWADCLKKHLGKDVPGLVGLEESGVWINYLKNRGQVRHWFRYLYRSPLFDLWKGWESGSISEGVEYRYWKRNQVFTKVFEPASVADAMRRVFSLPEKWKRIRWFGSFSDSMKKGTMASLGLLPNEVDREEEDADGWVYDSGPYYLVRYRKGGGLLLKDKDGTVWNSEDLAGEVNYSPEGVLTGTRQRWRTPG